MEKTPWGFTKAQPWNGQVPEMAITNPQYMRPHTGPLHWLCPLPESSHPPSTGHNLPLHSLGKLSWDSGWAIPPLICSSVWIGLRDLLLDVHLLHELKPQESSIPSTKHNAWNIETSRYWVEQMKECMQGVAREDYVKIVRDQVMEYEGALTLNHSVKWKREG